MKAKKQANDSAQKPPTPANPTRQHYQLASEGLAKGKGK